MSVTRTTTPDEHEIPWHGTRALPLDILALDGWAAVAEGYRQAAAWRQIAHASIEVAHEAVADCERQRARGDRLCDEIRRLRPSRPRDREAA